VLRLAGLPGEQVESSLDAFRRDDYALLDTLLGDREVGGSQTEEAAGSRVSEVNWLTRHIFPRRRTRRTRSWRP
jgi:hypothetical protein